MTSHLRQLLSANSYDFKRPCYDLSQKEVQSWAANCCFSKNSLDRHSSLPPPSEMTELEKESHLLFPWPYSLPFPSMHLPQESIEGSHKLTGPQPPPHWTHCWRHLTLGFARFPDHSDWFPRSRSLLPASLPCRATWKQVVNGDAARALEVFLVLHRRIGDPLRHVRAQPREGTTQSICDTVPRKGYRNSLDYRSQLCFA